MSIENNKLMNLADGKVLYDDVRGRAEDIKAGIAPDYSELTFPVSAGKRCWHDGVLYAAAQDIAQSEAWTAAHWTATTIDNELFIASTDSVVPVFSVADYQTFELNCNMTFAEVLAAISANKCTACILNFVEGYICLSLYTCNPQQIQFNSTIGGTAELVESATAVTAIDIIYKLDNSIELKTNGFILENIIAKDYDRLSFPVAAGALCLKGSNLYKATQNIQTKENWNQTHWQRTTIEDELKGITNNAPVVPVFSYDSTSGDYVCDKSFAEVYAAFQAGRCTSCTYMNQAYPLWTAGQYGVVFSGVTLASRLPVAMNTLVTLGNDESVQVTFNEFNLSNYVAPQYSNSIFPVSAGDLCITNNHLYKAKVDISSYESFNSSKWDEIILANELSDKTDKVSGATSGNFAGLDANGNLTDSGHKHSDYLTSHQDISGKADKADTVLDTTLSMGRKANTTVGTNSTALGYDVEASGNKSHAEGSETSATASSSHSEGYKSIASGQASHAEGGNTTSSGNMSHAEGTYSTASEYGSHAEGGYTEASNEYTHAEGLNSTASGYVAHAEGSETTASGAYSHAEGNSTTASGMDSHASGDHTTAYGRAETVVGSYNVAEMVTFSKWVSGTSYAVGDKVQNNSEYFICKTANSDTVFNHNNWDNVPYNTDKKGLFVVGNGYKPYTGSTVYSNAMFVDWDGNEELAGDLTVFKGTLNETNVSSLKNAMPVVPIFSVDLTSQTNNITCNMTFAEVYAAALQDRCTSCVAKYSAGGQIYGGIAFSITAYFPTQVIFTYSDTGDTFPDSSISIQTVSLVYNSDGTINADGQGIYRPTLFAPRYSDLTFPIAQGTLCIYSDSLFKARYDIATQEDFISAHWMMTSISEELSSQKSAINVLEPQASSSDVGKFLKAKTVADGKVSEYEFGEASGGGVSDVQVNGTSVVTNGVANIPIGVDSGALGVSRPYAAAGIAINGTGTLYINKATDAEIKAGTNIYHPIVPTSQHQSVFYGLAKAAGDSTQSASSNAVGTYTEDALSKISDMLNAPVSVSGTTPSITAKSGVRYICGEVATLTIVVPATGIIDVVFESGSTATVLTVTPPTGMTMRWANGFDPTSLEANTTYEINIANGCLGVAGSWT